jgi:hypothetical protein
MQALKTAVDMRLSGARPPSQLAGGNRFILQMIAFLRCCAL